MLLVFERRECLALLVIPPGAADRASGGQHRHAHQLVRVPPGGGSVNPTLHVRRAEMDFMQHELPVMPCAACDSARRGGSCWR